MIDNGSLRTADVREAALRPLAPSGPRFWAIAAVLSVLSLVGIVGFVIQLVDGLGVAGYTDQTFWSIYEANLVAFIGVSYGGALVSAILRLTHAHWRAPITRLAESMAVFSLVIGALYAIIHLGRPERIWELVVRPRIDSPIVWDFVAVTTYLVATLIFLYLPLIPDLAVLRERFRDSGGWRARLYRTLAFDWYGLEHQRVVLNRGITTIAILIIPIAVLVHSVLSWAFAVTSRPGWHSTIFGPYFVIAALYSGVAMVILVVAAFRKAYDLTSFIQLKHFQNLAYIMLALDVLYLYFTFTEFLTEGYAMTEDTASIIQALLLGQYAPSFWLFVLGGGLIPLLLVAVPRTRTVTGIVVASAFVVAGMWLKRILIVVPPAAHPLIVGPWGAFHLTWVSIAVTIGGAAAIPLLMMFFFKLVPVLGIDEIEQIAEENAHAIPAVVPTRESAVALSGRGGAR
jgi:Ni/Fe-hydrogenase subunit HybB-like protein